MKQTIEQIFHKQNPQDGECPDWAKKLANEYVNQQLQPFVDSQLEFCKGVIELKSLQDKYKIMVDSHAELLEAFITVRNELNATIPEKYIDIANEAIEKAKLLIKE